MVTEIPPRRRGTHQRKVRGCGPEPEDEITAQRSFRPNPPPASAAETPAAEETPAEAGEPGFTDVTIDACPPSEMSYLQVPLTVVSTAAADSSYMIEVSITDTAGVLVGTGSAYVERLTPGQTAKVEAFASITGPDGQFTCTITDVERYGSF